jgi:hypothetical protein
MLAVCAEGDVYAVTFEVEGERCYGLDGNGYACRLTHEQTAKALEAVAGAHKSARVVHYLDVPREMRAS